MFFPSSPVLVVEGTFAEAVLLETLVLSVLNHDWRSRPPRRGWSAPPPTAPASRWGRAHAGVVGRRRGPRRLHRRFRHDVQPRGGSDLGIPTAGTARTRSPWSTTPRATRSVPGRVARRGHHAARRHVRHRRGRRRRRRGRGPCARRGAHRLRRPRLLGPPGTRPARRPRRHGHPHRRHQRPRRARHRLARGRTGRRLRRRHGAGHRFGRSHQRLRLQARRARGRRRHPRPGGQESTEKLSVGGRKYALRRRRRPAGRGRGHRHRRAPVNDGDDRSLLVPLVEPGRRVHHDTLDDARARHRSALDELPTPPASCREANRSSRPSSSDRQRTFSTGARKRLISRRSSSSSAPGTARNDTMQRRTHRARSRSGRSSRSPTKRAVKVSIRGDSRSSSLIWPASPGPIHASNVGFVRTSWIAP